jgi:hypothetical protein
MCVHMCVALSSPKQYTRILPHKKDNVQGDNGLVLRIIRLAYIHCVGKRKIL